MRCINLCVECNLPWYTACSLSEWISFSYTTATFAVLLLVIAWRKLERGSIYCSTPTSPPTTATSFKSSVCRLDLHFLDSGWSRKPWVPTSSKQGTVTSKQWLKTNLLFINQILNSSKARSSSVCTSRDHSKFIFKLERFVCNETKIFESYLSISNWWVFVSLWKGHLTKVRFFEHLLSNRFVLGR